MSGLSSSVEYICQVDFGLVASARSILGLNVGARPFSRMNDGVESASASLASVRLKCWCWVDSRLCYWCWVNSRLWLLVPIRFRALIVGVGLVPGFDLVLGQFQALTVGVRSVLGLVVGVGSIPGFKDRMLMLDRLVVETEMIVSCARR